VQNSFWIANPLMRVHMCSLMFFRNKNELLHGTTERGTTSRQRKSRGSPSFLLWRNVPALWGVCDRLCTRCCDSARVDLRLVRPWNKALSLANEPSGTPRGGEYFTRIYVAFHAANTLVV